MSRGLITGGALLCVATLLAPDADAGKLRDWANRTKRRVSQAVSGAKRSLQRAGKRLRGAVSGAAKKLVDWGRRAVNFAKKKLAQSSVLKRLYGWLKGSPVIKLLTRKGKSIVRRLERSARALAGKYRVSRKVPAFLKRLATWRSKRSGGAK